MKGRIRKIINESFRRVQPVREKPPEYPQLEDFLEMENLESSQEYTPVPSRGNRYTDELFLDRIPTDRAINAYYMSNEIGCHLVTAKKRLDLLAMYKPEIQRRYKDGIDSPSTTYYAKKSNYTF